MPDSTDLISEAQLREVLADAEAAADTACAFRARVALAAVREEHNDLHAAIELLEAAVAEEFANPVDHVDDRSPAALRRAYLRLSLRAVP